MSRIRSGPRPQRKRDLVSLEPHPGTVSALGVEKRCFRGFSGALLQGVPQAGPQNVPVPDQINVAVHAQDWVDISDSDAEGKLTRVAQELLRTLAFSNAGSDYLRIVTMPFF